MKLGERKFVFIFSLLFLSGTLAFAQDYEEKSKESDELTMEAYRILDHYPDAVVEYDYEDGELNKVVIQGVEKQTDQDRLEEILGNLFIVRKELKNQKDKNLVYFNPEEEAEPAKGYQEFYDVLRNNLTYPEEAEDTGVEGYVFVKFIVSPTGEITNINSTNNLEGGNENLKNDLVDQAVQAVKETSGNWEPGEIDDVAVPSWVLVPIRFNWELNPTLPAPIG